MSDKAAASDTEPTEPPPARTLADALYDKFKGALALFGSVAAVSAFLVFAGFLSDYGAYTLAGLPRLSFSLTGLAESGADVTIDTLALLTQGTRVAWLLLLLGGVLLLWARHRRPDVQRWAGSRTLQRALWLVLLGLLFAVFGAMVDRASRSLSGEMHSAGALDAALTAAYRQHDIPDPVQRMAAIERQGFELRFYRLPNIMVGLEHAWEAARSWLGLQGVHSSDELKGFALRTLPESRRDARHLYGWLTLSVGLLLVALVLNGWWGQHLATCEPAPAPLTPRRGLRAWLAAGLTDDLDGAITRLVVPLCWGMTLLALALLPLLHGVLARTAIGNETVMVYLKPELGDKRKTTEKAAAGASAVKGKELTEEQEKLALFPEPSAMDWPKARFDCSKPAAAKTDEDESEVARGDLLERLKEYRSKLDGALRDFAQERPGEGEFDSKRSGLHDALAGFADEVIKLHCADAVMLFQQAGPSPGLSAQAPEVAEMFRREMLRVTTAYSVRIGTILGYPRDGHAMVLATQVVPRMLQQPGLWSLQGVRPEAISDSVVLPNLAEREAVTLRNAVAADHDNSDAMSTLLDTPRSEMLDALLKLLANRNLDAQPGTAAVTTLGTDAWAVAPERPHLSRAAIDHLLALISREPAALWPDKTERLRAAAWTALHLSRSPYAALGLARVLKAEPAIKRCPDNTGEAADTLPPGCIKEAATALGFHLADLRAEQTLFLHKKPRQLQEGIQTLEDELAALINGRASGDEVRGAACSALRLVGGPMEFRKVDADQLLASIAPNELGKYRFSSGACVLNINRVTPRGSDHAAFRTQMRAALRELVKAPVLAGHSGDDERRIRMAAFNGLQLLGLSSEHAFMFERYLALRERSPLQGMLRSAMDEVSADRLGRLLIDCGLDAKRSPDEREHCLRGVKHLKSNFDGDDGSAHRVVGLARESDGSLREAACETLELFNDRGGLEMRRRFSKDPAILAVCKPELGDKAPARGDDDPLAALRRLVEQAKAQAQSGKRP